MSRQVPRGRDSYRWFMTIATRWADNDAYGHVNNTVYYQWFDTAVNAWLVIFRAAELSRRRRGGHRSRPAWQVQRHLSHWSLHEGRARARRPGPFHSCLRCARQPAAGAIA